MAMETIGLFKAITAKMNYLDQRQQVIAQNIANADTPNYRPHDLSKVDFSSVLKNVTGSHNIRPVTTHENHMPSAVSIDSPDSRESKTTYEVAPAGNAVIVE